MSVVVACVHNLDVQLGHLRLACEFLTQEVLDKRYLAVEEPAYQSKRKHVAAFKCCLAVCAVSGNGLHHLCDGACHNPVWVYAKLGKIVVGLEIGLLQVHGSEAVSVDDDGGLGLGVLVLRLQCGGVHCHKYVTLVARSIDGTTTYVYLETAHTSKRTLRGTDVSRIVGECRNAIAHGCRNG